MRRKKGPAWCNRKPTRCDVPGCGIRNLSGLVGLRAHKRRSHPPEAQSPADGLTALIVALRVEVLRHQEIIRRLNGAVAELES